MNSHTSIKKTAHLVILATLVAANAQAELKSAAAGLTQLEPANTLSYDQPARVWQTECLPIGNGSLGGMIFGGVEQEHIQFNHATLWEGDEIDTGAYQNFGELLVDIAGEPQMVATNYRRTLDLDTATHAVEYTLGGVIYHREAFVSHPDQVMVTCFTADKPAACAATIRLTDAHGARAEATPDGRVRFSGKLANGLKYMAVAQVVCSGGTLAVAGDGITVKGADTITVLLAAGTDFHQDCVQHWRGRMPDLDATLAAAAAQKFAALRQRHVADHQRLYHRCVLTLAGTGAPVASTQERLVAFSRGADPAFEVLNFNYGRYLLIASSRAGGLPANLQGIWNNSNNPPWRCDYHSDINVDMAYWPAEVTNLLECHQPFFDYVHSIIPVRTRQTVDAYKCRGWTIRAENGAFGGSTWEWNNPGSAWYAMQFWRYWEFSQDREFLRDSALPVFRSVVEFWADFLKPGPEGKWVSPHGFSMEHGSTDEMGVTYDHVLAWDALSNYIETCDILGVEKPGRDKAFEIREKLQKPKIGKWGQFQEWLDDKDDPQDEHRHLSHLIGVYPGRQTIAVRDKSLAQAARVSLNARGDGGAGWCLPWKAALWARLGDGERAYKVLRQKLHPVIGWQGGLTENVDGTFPNLLTAVWGCFQADGNFGYSAAVAEMLLQSHADEISLLPTLPKAWAAQGSFAGLRARGGFTVGCTWKDGRVISYSIHAAKPAKVKLRINGEMKEVTAEEDPTNSTPAGE